MAASSSVVGSRRIPAKFAFVGEYYPWGACCTGIDIAQC